MAILTKCSRHEDYVISCPDCRQIVILENNNAYLAQQLYGTDRRTQLEEAQAERDREAAYAADLEAALACDTCQHPLNHIEHLKRDLAALRGEPSQHGG